MPPQQPATNIQRLRASALATDVLQVWKVSESRVKLYGSGQMEGSNVSTIKERERGGENIIKFMIYSKFLIAIKIIKKNSN